MSNWINPPLHLICGRCGNKNYLSFKIDPKGNEKDGNELPAVFIICDNCKTVTGLDEIISEIN
jgi:phage terminase large subunit GpA-like protein